MHIRPYEKLVAWREAHALCLRIYALTSTFPAHERFRLLDQMCRSSASAPTNIVEGCGKRSLRERQRFYEIASCSLEELHYQCLLARDLGYISTEVLEDTVQHINRTSFLVGRLRSSLND